MGKSLFYMEDQQVVDRLSGGSLFALTAANSPVRVRVDRFRTATLIINSPGGGPSVDVDLEINGIVGRFATVAGGANTALELPLARFAILTATGAGTARFAIAGHVFNAWGDLQFNR